MCRMCCHCLLCFWLYLSPQSGRRPAVTPGSEGELQRALQDGRRGRELSEVLQSFTCTCHTPHISHPISHISHFTPHTTYLTPHTTHLTPHISHHTPHTTHLTPHSISHTLAHTCTHHTPHIRKQTPHTTHTPHAYSHAQTTHICTHM